MSHPLVAKLSSYADLERGGEGAGLDLPIERRSCEDFVAVPEPELYFAPIDWYRTAFHELGHWTGHASRRDRNLSGQFDDAFYAREELVALSGQSAPPATLQ